MQVPVAFWSRLLGHTYRVVGCSLLTLTLSLAGCLDANEQTTPDLGVQLDVAHISSDTDTDGDSDESLDAAADQNDATADVQAECDAETPCALPFLCVDGRCQPECETNEACGTDRVCADFECFDVECSDQDASCDRYTQVCDNSLCIDNPCNLYTVVYDPQGATYDTVHLSGEFNADSEDVWPQTIADGGWPLEYISEDGVWLGKFEIPNGRYEYKLVLNESQFITDPSNPDTAPDPFGGQNSVLLVDCVTGPGACGDLEAFDWRDAVMYFVMVDRFADSDSSSDPVSGATGGDAASGASGQYEGGDLAGVTERMGYLSDLGVTALWLSTPYENRDTRGAAINPEVDGNWYSAYHGYWPSPANINYSDPDNPSPRPQVESRVGNEADLRGVIDAAHEANSANGDGIKVLFDYVMNHVDIDSGLYRAHADWFARRDGNIALCGPENLWDDPYWGLRCAFTDYLPPFDFDNASARAWSVNDALWWAQEFDIDGYRLDAIKHVSLTWLTDLRSRLNTAINDPAGGRFYLVGETFAYDDRNLLASFVDPDTMLDGQFDFPFKARLCDALFTTSGSLADFASWMGGNDGFYGSDSIMTTWIGNHDIPRAIHFASRQIGNCREGSHAGNGWTSDFPRPTDPAAYQRLGLAFAVMMTNPGIPLIYYGDEIGLAGGGDPDNRRMMPWNDDDLLPAQLELRDAVSALAQIRAENPVLARGRRLTRSSDNETWVYSMVGCGTGSRDVTVAINRADSSRSIDVPAGDYIDLISGEAVSGGSVSVSARSFVVLRRE